MAYIANKPVRFDRNYKVGEIIPPEVIEPKMIRKLMDMGRIVSVNLPADKADHVPDATENTDKTSELLQESVQDASDCAESTEGTNIPGSEETEQDGQNTLPVQQCESDDKAEFMNPPQENTPDAEKAASQPQESVQDASVKDGEFVCSICGRSFGSKNALSAHSRIHTN